MSFMNNAHARERGLDDGYQLGHANGVRLGQCEAIMQKAIRDRAPSPVWDVRVLFVTREKATPTSQ